MSRLAHLARHLAATFACTLPALLPLTALAQGAVVSTPQVRAELVAHAPQGLGDGRDVQLGLLIEHQPKWHTYWKNPGDSGLPTRLTWQLPAGVTASEVQWPTPLQLPLGPLMNFGYDGRLLLPVSLSLPKGFAAPSLEVKLQAEWLVCREVCIPESGEFSLTLPAQAATASHANLFKAAAEAIPVRLADARGRVELRANQLLLTVDGLPQAWQGREVIFFPETGGVIQNAAKPRARWSGASWSAEVPIDPQRSASPQLMPAVFTVAGAMAGVQLELPVTGSWPAPGAVVTEPLAPAGTATEPPMGLALAIGFALLGGLLLNLMPCVFPVLSLKVLSFSRHAHDRRAVLATGLAYTAGVMLSFLALAGLLLALRAGGEQLGWGFQLQSPWIIAALAALFTLIGLNLSGVFEFNTLLPGNLASMQLRHPLLDAGLTGLLAVVVAAPCTAPFMGASLGLAITLPTGQALLVFAALGLGMALPFLLASAFPAAARAMPRPGAWMATFKGLMAFPMFATVIWLVWVLGRQVGVDGVAALLGSLLVLALLAWSLGAPARRPGTRWVLGTLSVLLMAGALAWLAPVLRADAPVAAADAGADWQPWSAERVAEAQAQGRPVFVDFTAAWCVTCQYNKRVALADAAVRADFAARQVLLLRADWTRRDAAISAELSRLGRSGVPVYALYSPGGGAPKLFSEILSAAELRAGLAALGPTTTAATTATTATTRSP